MSNFQDILNSRRTVYHFTNQEIKDSDLEIAFEAASNAPCHKQTHPWNYYVIGKKTRESLLPTVILLAEDKHKKNGEIEEKYAARAVSKILDVPVIIAVTTKMSPNDSFREEEDYAATVCSLHNLVLSLWDLGIGSQWSTGAITRHTSTYDILKINPDNERIIGFLKIGYPKDIPTKEKKKVFEIRRYLP
ncbi:MAG: hypothetical protein CMB72_03410 [Euryarchaeota archaeon]|nr:hypothetical protein [Euryarchaeota archaeon]|tara:strand:+ start:196 stop:765 length:570 start_codon:yes stop_codon:yes gene_type:complete